VACRLSRAVRSPLTTFTCGSESRDAPRQGGIDPAVNSCSVRRHAPPRRALDVSPGRAGLVSAERWASPPSPRCRAGQLIRSRRDVLIAAPTGSGKTLTAFLACLDELFRAPAAGKLERPDARAVSSLRSRPWATTCRRTCSSRSSNCRPARDSTGVELPEIRVMVRSGDSTPTERAADGEEAAAHSHHHARVVVPVPDR
jgi:hypothetical protein